jgi:hypothetical protein
MEERLLRRVFMQARAQEPFNATDPDGRADLARAVSVEAWAFRGLRPGGTGGRGASCCAGRRGATRPGPERPVVRQGGGGVGARRAGPNCGACFLWPRFRRASRASQPAVRASCVVREFLPCVENRRPAVETAVPTLGVVLQRVLDVVCSDMRVREEAPRSRG